MNSFFTKIRNKLVLHFRNSSSSRLRVCLYIGMAVAFVVFVSSLYSVVVYQVEAPFAPDGVVGDPIASSTAATMNPSYPVRLRVPKIHLDAPFTEEPLGLDEDKAVEVPEGYEEVGWYRYGPTPGSLGPAVVLGHVDSLDGAAVFYLLGQLEPGDSVFVDREDGTTAEFTVTALERTPQSEFPTQKVYGNIDFAGLRLITCTGKYDKGSLRYSHNLVVYAALKEPSTP